MDWTFRCLDEPAPCRWRARWIRGRHFPGEAARLFPEMPKERLGGSPPTCATWTVGVWRDSRTTTTISLCRRVIEHVADPIRVLGEVFGC